MEKLARLRYKGFFSYARVDNDNGVLSSWRDSIGVEVRQQLGSECHIYQDIKDIEVGQPFSREIENALNEADFMIVIITPSYLNSDYCRKELQHYLDTEKQSERQDTIIPIYFRDSGLTKNEKKPDITKKDELAKELNKRQLYDWRQLRLDEFKSAKVQKAFNHLGERIVEIVQQSPPSKVSFSNEQRLDEIVEEIKNNLILIQDQVNNTSFRRLFRAKLIRNVLKATKTEIGKLCAPLEEYVQDLSLPESFIIRAGAIFEEANNLCAVSIDELSQFWIAEDQRTRAQEYTARQPDKAKRLFVFSNFENAAKYRNVMAAHHQQYGLNGGVFFCSKQAYINFLKTLTNDSEIEELKTKDFAIIIFEDESGKDYYESTLSATKLVCRRRKKLKSYQERILEYFEELATELEPGQMHEDLGFIKYKSDFQSNDEEWGLALAKIFDSANSSSGISGSIYHLVFISKDIPKEKLIKEINTNLRPKLRSLTYSSTQEKLIEDLWFGKRNKSIDDLNVIDGIHKGQIKTKNLFVEHYQCCLVMKFKNVNFLKEYYQDEIHSEVRQELYKLSDPTMNSLYEMMSEPDKLDSLQKKAFYNAIEGSVSRFFVRADYLQEDPLDYIVKIEAVPFQLSDNRN